MAVQVERALARELDAAATTRRANLLLSAVFTATVFLGSGVLFLLEPMVAKMALPLYGGTAAVWNTALVFFQFLLLAGYLYAHGATRTLGMRRQPLVHLAVLVVPFLVLPITLPSNAAPPAGQSPVVWLLYALGVAAALPFFVVSATSPLLQRWFSVTNHPAAHDPYFLYAAGNAGSLAALVCYPLFIEPHLTLSQQSRAWLVVYALFAVACAACVVLLRRNQGSDAHVNAPARGRTTTSPTIAWRTRATWTALAFLPSSLMAGTTSFLSADVAAIPLLWVAPLAIYLVTFIVAFSRRPLVRVEVARKAFPFAVFALLIAYPGHLPLPILVTIVTTLGLLFLAGTFAHGRLAQTRPGPDRLTEFYLILSLGGMLGGAFNALVAPVLFNDLYEYPVVIVLTLLACLAGLGADRQSRMSRALDVLLPIALFAGAVLGVSVLGLGRFALVAAVGTLVAFVRRPARFAIAASVMLLILSFSSALNLYSERTFYGVLHVDDGASSMHVLNHGTTVHGKQSFASVAAEREPLTYYTRSGPLGQLFDALQSERPFERVGVVGLGAGSIAAYGQPGQRFTFFEIDPAVVRIASDARFFTYLRDSQAAVRTVIGDGRLQLAKEPDGEFDLLVLDAFSSDAIPTHLLTRQAIELYLRKLTDEGVIAIHISNHNIDLQPVIAAAVADLGLTACYQTDGHVSHSEIEAGKSPSEWVAVAKRPESLAPLAGDGRWQPTHADGVTVWTDDFSNVVSVLRWLR